MLKAVQFIGFILLLIVSCNSDHEAHQKPQRDDYAAKLFSEARLEQNIDIKLDLLSSAKSHLVSISDTLLYDILDYQIYYHDMKKSYDSSLYYSNEMINNAAIIKDTANMAKGYYRKARIFLYLNKQEQVLENMYRSQNLYKAIGDSINVGRRLVELANSQVRLGDFAGGHQTATDALNFIPENDSVFLGSLHTLLGLTSSKLDDFDTSIKENSAALKYVKSKDDSVAILNNIAVNYRRLGDFKKSDEILQRAQDMTEDSLGLILTLKDNYYYNQFLQNEKNVIPELEKIAHQRKSINDSEGLLSSYQHLSSIYLEYNEPKARKAARQYLHTAEAFGNPLEKLKALQILIQLQDDNVSTNYAKEFITLNDSIITARNKIKNLFAKIKFDEEQKLEEIEDLEQLSAANRLQAEKEKNEKTLILIALVFLLMAAIIIYYFIKQRHKRDKIKEIYETEARLSKKVHDELANDIFQIMTDKSLTDPILKNKLDAVYLRTRDISKENSLIHTGADFSEELEGMISSTIPSTTKVFVIGLKNINWDFYTQEKKIVIYRVLQELLVNFRKHSKATRLNLKFETINNNLQIVYKDNGMGTILNSNKFSGLRNMENRIHLIDGTITFQSEPGSGFSCLITLNR